MSDKPHAATAKQRERFRDRGEFARSRDLTSTGVLLAAFLTLLFGSQPAFQSLIRLTRDLLGNVGRPMDHSLGTMARDAFVEATGPLLLACVLAAALIGLAQTGGRLPKESLRFDPTRLNPLPKLKEMFTSTQALLNLFFSVGKVSVVLAVCAFTIWQKAPALLADGPATFKTILDNGGDLMASLAGRALGVFLLIAAGDYGLNWLKLEKKMRMSTEELRREMKDQDGDPMVRRRRRQKQIEMSRQRSLKEVASADVVLVNPTHYAVALKYDANKMGAPRLVAKGADNVAVRIRGLARKAGVPVVSQPPLTRMLYGRVGVGKEIPADLYQAVALVLSYIYRLRGRTA